MMAMVIYTFVKGCLNDDELIIKIQKAIDCCEPPTAYQASYY